jgi:molybdate transport system ATP-binding protein
MSAKPEPLKVALSQAGPIPLEAAFECRPGELLALIGPSGAGKTTVLRAIAGLYRPLAGRISCGGETWFDSAARLMLPPQARSVGLVFQDYALFPHLSALNNVRLAMRHVPEPERAIAAEALLKRVHLEELKARRPEQMSGGQRQRVAIARALARDPKVLLLDEPFSAVDRMTREPLKEELSELRRSLEIPILLVTHDLGEAQALADRICVLDHGRTLQCCSPEEMRLKPASAAVARLMGQPNVFEGVLEEAAAAGKPGRLRWAGGVLALAATGPFRAGDKVNLFVPSECIAFAAGGQGENVIAGTIEKMRPHGDVSAAIVGLPDAGAVRLRFTLTPRERIERGLIEGRAVRLQLKPAHLHLLAR